MTKITNILGETLTVDIESGNNDYPLYIFSIKSSNIIGQFYFPAWILDKNINDKYSSMSLLKLIINLFRKCRLTRVIDGMLFIVIRPLTKIEWISISNKRLNSVLLNINRLAKLSLELSEFEFEKLVDKSYFLH
jgi:hypothetical protein